MSLTTPVKAPFAFGNQAEEEKEEERNGICPVFSRRRLYGEYHNLILEMKLSDQESHFRYIRMSKERFDTLL